MPAKNDKSSRWPIAKLKPYPLQAPMFGDISDAELAALAADMKETGQHDAVDILPGGTILAGHQRVRAARLLGWKYIEVAVRHDLEKAGPAAIRRFFIGDNLYRRHLSPLGRARAMQALMENECGDDCDDDCDDDCELTERQVEKLKADIARKMQLSLRSVNRYLAALRSPPAVQEAFDRHEISLIYAGKISLLDEDVRAAVAARIECGEPAAQVVAGALKRPPTRSDIARAYDRLMVALARAYQNLNGQIGHFATLSIARIDPRIEARQAAAGSLTETRPSADRR